MMETLKHRTHIAVCLILEKEGEFLLLRRANTGWGDGYYGLPGGSLNAGESIREAMVREAKEEIGIDIDKDDLSLSSVVHAASHPENPRETLLFFFSTEKYLGEIANCEPHKCDDMSFFAYDALPENFLPAGLKALRDYHKEFQLYEPFWETSAVD